MILPFNDKSMNEKNFCASYPSFIYSIYVDISLVFKMSQCLVAGQSYLRKNVFESVNIATDDVHNKLQLKLPKSTYIARFMSFISSKTT